MNDPFKIFYVVRIFFWYVATLLFTEYNLLNTLVEWRKASIFSFFSYIKIWRCLSTTFFFFPQKLLKCNGAEFHFELFPIESIKTVNVLGNRGSIDHLVCWFSTLMFRHECGRLGKPMKYRHIVGIKRQSRRLEIWKKFSYSYFVIFR